MRERLAMKASAFRLASDGVGKIAPSQYCSAILAQANLAMVHAQLVGHLRRVRRPYLAITLSHHPRVIIQFSIDVFISCLFSQAT